MAHGRAVAGPAAPEVLVPEPGAGEPVLPELLERAGPELARAAREPVEPALAGPAARVRAARALV